jgi:type VI protein secretion system component Hcp
VKTGPALQIKRRNEMSEESVKKVEQPEPAAEPASPTLSESDLKDVVGGASSPSLFKACANGKHIAKATITV